MTSLPGVVLVTGAAGDVGSTLVRRLSAAGVQTVAADLADALAGAALGDGPGAGRVRELPVDLTAPESVQALAAAVLAECASTPDSALGMVHCAGVARVAPLDETTDAELDLMYQVNQRAPLVLTRDLLPALRAAAGSVVFVASDSARSGAGQEVAYSATKAALIGAAKSLARELGRYGTRVNVVSPGPIEGAMTTDLLKDKPEYLERLERSIPLRRLATPDDVAACAQWLLGSESGYVTGQTISVSGGITMH